MKFKKTICIISAFVLITSAFCACNKKTDEEQTTTQPTVTVGEEAYTTQSPELPGENVIAHMSSNNLVLKNDYYDDDGKIKFVEEYVYDEYAIHIGCIYYDADGKFVAKLMINENKFFDESGKELGEEEFLARMRAIGAAF